MRSFLRHRSILQVVCCGLFLSAAILVSRAQTQQAQPQPAPPQQAPPQQAQPQPAKPQQDGFPDGPGKAVFLRTCSVCHTPANVVGKAQDADAWTDTLNKMIQFGAAGSDDDFGAILGYLTTNFGPVPDKININKATSMNLRSWLNFTQKQADAIVSCRTKSGGFKSVDDLKKVPDIDLKIIDANKDRLIF